jgi:hypothetical protein
MPPDKKHARWVTGRTNSLELLPSSELTTEDAVKQHFRQGCAVLAFLQHPNLSSFLAAFPHLDSQQTFPRVRKSYE